MKSFPVSAAALTAMTGLFVLTWQTPGPSANPQRFAQAPTPPAATNPVTPTPGAPSKSAIPEKFGEPVTTVPAPDANTGGAPASPPAAPPASMEPKPIPPEANRG